MGPIKQEKSNDITLQDVKNFLSTTCIIAGVVVLFSVLYLFIPDMQKNLPWIKPYINDAIEVGSILFVMATVILNSKLILRWILKILKKVILLLLTVLKRLVKHLALNLFKVELFKEKKVDKQSKTRHSKDLELDQMREQLLLCFKSYELNFLAIKKIEKGPSITKFTLHMDSTGRLPQLMRLQNEMTMFMQTERINIYPTSQGVVMEIPNYTREIVTFQNVIQEYRSTKERKSIIEVPLGKSTSGELISCRLDKCPHLLIAGQTGSGKSVCINVIISSLMLLTDPEEVKFILVDPKMVELSMYNDSPHLYTPVITDPKDAEDALLWGVEEMERRYQKLCDHECNNIANYNKEHPENKMQYIIIIIDEIADLMMLTKKSDLDIETNICRLGQKARAAGIHMILATQRPSVDVITGLIKANVPARIAFSVSSQVDSRTILDEVGAEKLLGEGDGFLSMTDMREFVRFQCAFITNKEVKEIVEQMKRNAQEGYIPVTLIPENKENELENDFQVSDSETIIPMPEREVDEREIKILLYINRLLFNSLEDEVILPSTNEISKKLNIRKSYLLKILSELEQEEMIRKVGERKGAKTYVKISKEDAEKFLKKYSN